MMLNFARRQGRATVSDVALGNELRVELTRLQQSIDRFTRDYDGVATRIRTEIEGSLDEFKSSLMELLAVSLRAQENDLVQAIVANVERNESTVLEFEQLAAGIDELLAMAKVMDDARIPVQVRPEVKKAAEIIEDGKLELKQRLRLTIPIIPLLLTYMGEVEIKAGLSLTSLWESVCDKFAGKSDVDISSQPRAQSL